MWLPDFIDIVGPAYLMMVNAYFDESGTHAGSPVVCVAGYLYEAEQARRLDDEWRGVLSKFGVTHFHAVDCAHRKGEFSVLTERDRDELVTSLVDIIKLRMTIGIAVSLSDADFGAFDVGNWHFEGAYPLCALWALAGVVAWAEKHHYSGKISYFFEKGHRHRQLTESAIDMLHERPAGERYMRFHSARFVGKKDLRPLQTADILAYEWFKELNRINGPRTGRLMRRSLERLLESPHMHYHFSARDIQQFVAEGAMSLSQRFDFVW